MTSQIIPMPQNNGLALSPGHAMSAARPQQPENPILLLHRYLRGRYPLAIILAVVLAVPGAMVGYRLTQPIYTSKGIVRIAPTLPVVMYPGPDNQLPPMWEQFMSTQASMLSTPRVLALASESDQMRSTGWSLGPEGTTTLARALTVSRRGGELIFVDVNDVDPRRAQAAVNAVLAAYETVHEENAGMTATKREQIIRGKHRELQRDIETLRAQIADLARPFGTDDLDQLYRAKVTEKIRLDTIIADLEIMLAAAQAEGNRAEDGELSTDLQVERLAARDRTLSDMLDRRRAIEAEVQSLTPRLSPAHRTMVQLVHRRDQLDDAIAARVEFLKASGPGAAALPGRPDEAGAMSVPQIQELLARHRQAADRLQNEALEIGRTRLSIGSLRESLFDRRKIHDEVSRQLEQIEVENRSVSAGRISILQRGDLPVLPSKDRRFPLAVLGAMGGAGMGVGFVVLMSLLQGGYRYIDDVERSAGSGALLGTVPDLDSGTPEQAALAALSVHHLRNMLQMNTPHPDGGGTIYGITSPSAGDGKTSLALSLAMSFAAMGHRTLLVDADLVGSGLSRQLELTNVPGLCQALKSATLDGEIHETRVANLSALPVGFAEHVQPEQIARTDLQAVLTRARDSFDTIIVDTGPILGSLEANLISPMCDRMVMVVARGQRGKLLRSALERLARLGATCGGLIFNRADVNDFDRSVNSVSLSGRSIRDPAAKSSKEPGPGALRLLKAVGTQGPEAKAS
jgi:polysaccharide biosynthesis transport protein